MLQRHKMPRKFNNIQSLLKFCDTCTAQITILECKLTQNLVAHFVLTLFVRVPVFSVC